MVKRHKPAKIKRKMVTIKLLVDLLVSGVELLVTGSFVPVDGVIGSFGNDDFAVVVTLETTVALFNECLVIVDEVVVMLVEDVVTFDNGVVMFNKGVVTLDKGVVAFSKGVVTVTRQTLPMKPIMINPAKCLFIAFK